MSDQQLRVTFQPHGRAVYVLGGTKILEAAARAGLTLQTPCGGAGTCGKCRVQIPADVASPCQADSEVFDEQELADGWRLACQTPVIGDMVVTIPASSRFSEAQIFIATETGADEAGAGAGERIVPAVRKIYVELPEPSLADDAPDRLRLERETGAFKVDLPLLRRLGGLLRDTGFKGTAVLADHRLIDFEAGDTTAACYGLAFDVGTTTVVGTLLDLHDGRELAVASSINPQVSFGDDVLSRIKCSTDTQGCLGELRDAIVGAVMELTLSMCAEAGVEPSQVYEIVFAGNTTMEHLLCGVDPSQLGQAPFVAAYGRGLIVPAADMGLRLHPSARAYVYPVIGGFVGGDTVAGMLATGVVDCTDGPAMMVDIGTNGEIVLAHEGRLWAASTAAGPAFEGARISCGMRAATGAIEKVVFDDDVHCNVIGIDNADPIGLCGSGLIDAAAGLLDAGLVTPEGRMLGPDELDASAPQAIARRLRPGDNGQGEFLLAASGASGGDVTLTQRDIRELQLATGAIRAGIRILLKPASLECGDLARVLIAGGFGSFIRRSCAQRIGLLPTEIDHSRIRYVGNASLNGARWALLSTAARSRADQLARQTTHVELSMDTAFQTEFAEAMIFPTQ